MSEILKEKQIDVNKEYTKKEEAEIVDALLKKIKISEKYQKLSELAIRYREENQ